MSAHNDSCSSMRFGFKCAQTVVWLPLDQSIIIIFRKLQYIKQIKDWNKTELVAVTTFPKKLQSNSTTSCWDAPSSGSSRIAYISSVCRVSKTFYWFFK